MDIQERVEEITDVFPVSIEALVRLFGIELDKKAILPEGISGQIEKLDNGKYKISCNKGDHYFRQRFTMAHELSHFLLHKEKVGNGVTDDVKYSNTTTTSHEFYNEKIQKNEEAEANGLASTFLMPKKLLRDYIGKDLDENSLKELATKFQVSPPAMKLRLDILRRNT